MTDEIKAINIAHGEDAVVAEKEGEEKKEERRDEIALAIDRLIYRVYDISFSAKTFIPKAAKWHVEQIEKTLSKIQSSIKIYDGDDDTVKATALANIIELDRKLERLKESEVVRTLAIGHFLNIFSAYDAFTGDLLAAFYKKNPDLYKGINATMTVSDMLQYENIDSVKAIILNNEIETFRRKSYVEQFEALENKFSIKLKKFDRWPEFVECSQRRNLLTHCDGVVSDQYLRMCKKEGCKLDPPSKVGEKLGLPPKYLIDSCSLVIEVGLKLGQTLWRDQFESEIAEADKHLHSVIYDLLKKEQYLMAIMVGEFYQSLPKCSSETSKIIMIINYAIALKFSGNNDKAMRVLEARDWDPLCNDFKLAVSVLREEYALASDIMKRIGEEGEFVTKHGYQEWPLLKKFRESPEFQSAYNEIYGHPFVKDIKIASEEAKVSAGVEIKKIEDELSAEHEVHCAKNGTTE